VIEVAEGVPGLVLRILAVAVMVVMAGLTVAWVCQAFKSKKAGEVNPRWEKPKPKETEQEKFRKHLKWFMDGEVSAEWMCDMWHGSLPSRKGRPSRVEVEFTKAKEIRFDFGDSSSTGGIQELKMHPSGDVNASSAWVSDKVSEDPGPKFKPGD
jgi:hypothetical protein